MSAADNERQRQKRREAASRGMCSGCCIREPKPGGKLCPECVGYSDIARDKRVAEGKCRCGRAPRPGLATCQTCADRMARYAAARKAS